MRPSQFQFQNQVDGNLSMNRISSQNYIFFCETQYFFNTEIYFHLDPGI